MIAVRLGMIFLPFRTVSRLVTRHSQPRSSPESTDLAQRDKIIWAIGRANEYVPGDRACLQQAFVGQLLLGRRGFAARLRIGVRKGADGELLAHAWVENRGDVVIGGPASETSRYTALHELDNMSVHS